MRWLESRRGLVVSLSVLAAAGASALPADAAKKPFKTKSKVLQYRANQGTPATTLYKGRVFSIKASCPDAKGTEITYTSQTDWLARKFLVTPTGSTASSLQGPKGQSATEQRFAGMGELVAFDPSLKKVATVDSLYGGDGPGRRLAGGLFDCVWTGIVTEVGKRDLIAGKSDSTRELNAPRPWNLNLECVADNPLISGVGAGDETVGISHFGPDGLRQRFFNPLSSSAVLLGNPGDPISDLGDLVSLSSETIGAEGFRFMTRGPASPGGKCSAVGIDKTDTPSGGFVRSAPTAREVFHREEGLRLSASCESGSMKVYASTSKPESLLGVSIIGDGDPVYVPFPDFSKTEADPEFILNFANLSRSGQIGYVQPNGKTVFLNFVGSNSGANCSFGVISTRG